MITVGDLREILAGLELDDDVEVRLEDSSYEVNEAADVVLAPVAVYSNYEGFIVDKEDYAWTDDDESFEEDIADAEPMLVIRSA